MIFDPAPHRYITVFPTQYLLILQIGELPTPHFLQDSRNVIELGYFFLSDIFPSLLSPAGNGAKIYSRNRYNLHVAFEYDPAWDTVNHSPLDIPAYSSISTYGSRLLEDMVMSTAWEGQFSFVWFIDYRIKGNPSHQATTGEDSDRLSNDQSWGFHASDRRFVQVKEGQLGWKAGHEKMWDAGYEIPTEESSWHCCGSAAFINHLDDEVEHKDNDDGDAYLWGGPIYDLERVSYGLLACEYL